MAESTLYEIYPIDQGWPEGIIIDCLLVAGGSDYRAYEVLRKCSASNITVGDVVIFEFEERVKSGSVEKKLAHDSYSTLPFALKKIPCRIKDPSLCLKTIANYGVGFSHYSRIAIDISCFTKPYFFSIIKFLKEYQNVRALTVFYTEPKSYLFPKGLYISYQSTLGPLSVLEIPGFPGQENITERKLLVILLGFDGELSVYINEEISPDEVILVNGFPGYSPKFKDISLICNEKLSGNLNNQILYARANNPFDTFNLLEILRAKYQNSSFSVAPLGTKPMALGACLFAIANPSVRVIYPLPDSYTDVTTDECWRSWLYTLPMDI